MSAYRTPLARSIGLPGALSIAIVIAGCQGAKTAGTHIHSFAITANSRAEVTSRQADLSAKAKDVRDYMQLKVPSAEAQSSFFMALELPLAKADFYAQLISELNAAAGDVESLKVVGTIGVLRALDRDLQTSLAVKPSSAAQTAAQPMLQALLDSVTLSTDALSRAYATADRDGVPTKSPQNRVVLRMQLFGAYPSRVLIPAAGGGTVTSRVTCPTQTTPGSVTASISLNGTDKQVIGGFSSPLEALSSDASGNASLSSTAPPGAILEVGGSANNVNVSLPDLDAGDCTVEVVTDNVSPIPAIYFSSHPELLKVYAKISDSLLRQIFATTQAIRAAGTLGSDSVILATIEAHALERLNRMAQLRAYALQDHVDGETAANVDIVIRLGRIEKERLVATLSLRDGSFKKLGDLLDQLTVAETAVLPCLK